MRQGEDDELPVPDPDARPIHPRELAAAESRMLADMQATGLDAPPLSGDVAAARAEIEQQNARELSENEAAVYRLSPENQLDWLGDGRRHHGYNTEMDSRENHLDWLEHDRERPLAPREDGAWQEPDRDRR